MKTVVWLRRYCQILGTVVALLTIGFWVTCAADDEKGDSTSEAKPSSTIQTPHVATLFDDEVLADNVFAVRQKAKQRLAVARYESLRGWVLPSKSHRDFRLAGKQTPTDPVAPLIDAHRFDLERQRAGVERGDRRIHTGSNLVSPTLDLIENAGELGKLDEASQFLVGMLDAQIRPQNCSGPAEWDRLITSLIGRIEHLGLPPAGQSQPWNTAPDLKTWHLASRIHSWGHGSGIPSGHLQFSEGTLKTLAYMDDEFLFFASPLRGNYSLECDCTGFGWKELYPFVAGSWITPVHDHKSVQVGELYRVDRSEPIEPRLSRVDDSIHFRVDARDNGVFAVYQPSPKPKLLPGQPPGWQIFDCDWSPDGREILFTAEPPREE